MPLLLRESDMTRLLRMDDVIAAVEDAFRQLGTHHAVNRPRQRSTTGTGTILHVMSAAIPPRGVMGLKAYTSAPGGTQHMGMLYSVETGELLAMMEVHRLGQLRTGAASAVATKYLARANAGSIGILGTGGQARTQVMAISRVRPVALVKCYSRTAQRREAFAEEMVQELGGEVVAVDSARDAVDAVDIIVTATSAKEPVLLGTWLKPGVHVNAIGSNAATRRELDGEAIRRSDRIAVDDLEQAKQESGDLIAAFESGVSSWDRVVELGQIVVGEAAGRTSPQQVTLFESQGIAAEDVATMKLVYDRALQLGVGEHLQPEARHEA
jgi:ornithine cyclodeaminase/alanine dehydrogenase-like protein (mu-crystallin family)